MTTLGRIAAALGMTALVLLVGIVMTTAYLAHVTPPPTHVERNEWGQRAMTQEELCAATIMRWTRKCEEGKDVR